jgi:hypothetical protein
MCKNMAIFLDFFWNFDESLWKTKGILDFFLGKFSFTKHHPHHPPTTDGFSFTHIVMMSRST